MLCGGVFGLGARGDDGIWRALRRHRLFETSWAMLSPPCHCDRKEKIGVYGNGGGWATMYAPSRRGYKGHVREWRDAMQMPWAMTAGLAEAIPPAYAEFIGRAAIHHLTRAAA
jgi:DNA (cytosine-5)-methyltransferase 1